MVDCCGNEIDVGVKVRVRINAHDGKPAFDEIGLIIDIDNNNIEEVAAVTFDAQQATFYKSECLTKEVDVGEKLDELGL